MAAHYDGLRAELAIKGGPLAPLDMLIGAHTARVKAGDERPGFDAAQCFADRRWAAGLKR